MTARALILVYLHSAGAPVTTVEIAATLALDPGTARRHLRALVREGRVTRTSATFGNQWAAVTRVRT